MASQSQPPQPGVVLAVQPASSVQSEGQSVDVSPALQMPSPQKVLGGQSVGHVEVLSLASQVPSPQKLDGGQSVTHEAVVSPASQIPLPHTGPLVTHLNPELQVWLLLHEPQVPLHAATEPHL